MAPSDYAIRTMSRHEIDSAIEWAAAEGWNPGLYDADCFYAADPEGFLMGEIKGEPVSCISAVQYGDTFGFIGFYIVRPDYRGQGLGIQIWNAALKRLAKRNIGLDGVVAQQDNYRKSGFKLAYRNIRYESLSGESPIEYPGIVKLSQVSFETIEAYDKAFFPDDRARFLNSWLNQPECVALGIVQKNKLSGYGVIRACRSGYKIGPLFADHPESAEALYLSLKSSVQPGKPVYLDIPEINRDAIALTEKYGMSLVFETARMYTGPAPSLPLDKVFGVTSFELG